MPLTDRFPSQPETASWIGAPVLEEHDHPAGQGAEFSTSPTGVSSQFARISRQRPIVLRQVLGQRGQADADCLAFAAEADECEREESADRAIDLIGRSAKLFEKEGSGFPRLPKLRSAV